MTVSAREVAVGGWRGELQAFLGVLPRKRTFALLAVSWICLFQFLGNSTFGYIDTNSLFAWMYNAYTAPATEDGHGNWIPLVVLGLIYWKRKRLSSLPLVPWNLALVLLAGALLLHLLGFVVQQPRVSIVAFFAGLWAITGLCWGRDWLRHTLFPWCLFVFCVPVGSLVTVVTLPLRLLVTELAVSFASLALGLEVISEGTLIRDLGHDYQYDVAPACSGIRSLAALLVLAIIFGFVSFRSPWRRLAMVFASIPLAVIGNVLRIIMIIVIGDMYGQETGLKAEQNLGFATFFLVGIAGLVILSRLMEEREVGAEAARPAPDDDLRAGASPREEEGIGSVDGKA